MEDGVRRIESIGDVVAVLDSERASFPELMDCVRIARSHDEWELRKNAAERAFQLTLGNTSSKVDQLEMAAETVVHAVLREAADLDSLETQVQSARTHLAAASNTVSSDRLRQLDQDLAELLVLLSDDETQSLVRLSSRLRKVDRSDLAVVAGTRARDCDPEDAAVRTTLGAAFADLQCYREALEELKTALRIAPDSTHVLNALSRAMQENGDPRSALEIARRSLDLDGDNEYSAHRMLSAAAAVDDSSAFQSAVEVIEGYRPKDPKTDVWLLVLSAEVLAEQGRTSEARHVLQEIMQHPSRGTMAKRIAKLKRTVMPSEQLSLYPADAGAR